MTEHERSRKSIRPRAGGRLAGACLLVGLTVGVSGPAFAGSSWLQCPSTPVNEGDSFTVAVLHGGLNHAFDGIFTTTAGTAGSSDYTELSNAALTLTANQGAKYGVDTYNAKEAST